MIVGIIGSSVFDSKYRNTYVLKDNNVGYANTNPKSYLILYEHLIITTAAYN